ncbi:hypothetical protein WA026_019875 [Henosepilachna vigintioctopunctata]|uniref:Uncharacterized protein n=1 Tax=Henosepilachna vigintioctopunctata TaxID=420089 RepID=A0AAW1VER7_9CUCU
MDLSEKIKNIQQSDRKEVNNEANNLTMPYETEQKYMQNKSQRNKDQRYTENHRIKNIRTTEERGKHSFGEVSLNTDLTQNMSAAVESSVNKSDDNGMMNLSEDRIEATQDAKESEWKTMTIKRKREKYIPGGTCILVKEDIKDFEEVPYINGK